ncbi:MAG: class I SAM-dependent methyltransferase [Pedobacter sp.]|nr:class I SAM-dependent methyltransferase [Pedobacter sp.]MDQ8052756.1 class I SAM-dependent methyltransferase [Pedobacter sp.]
MKDNFSTQAQQYAQFRPRYPESFYHFLSQHVKDAQTAWDCATGNGQVAVELAKIFAHVDATDISSKQLANAPQLPNITYKIEPGEKTAFADQSFDLITVAQAIHWFKFDEFFAEVKRVLKPDGLFVAVGYGLMKITPSIDALVDHLYEAILGTYWDEERRHIESGYATIPFPFEEIEAPPMEILASWTFDQLIGYLETWSSLQHYIKANGQNPIELVFEELKKAWGNQEIVQVHFPLIIKAGRI